jgi:hypothetical protein
MEIEIGRRCDILNSLHPDVCHFQRDCRPNRLVSSGGSMKLNVFASFQAVSSVTDAFKGEPPANYKIRPCDSGSAAFVSLKE